MAYNLSLYTVEALLILDNEGKRVLAKYYQPPRTGGVAVDVFPEPTAHFAHVKTQKQFEKGLFDKTRKQNQDVTIYDNHVVVYKEIGDVVLYVVGSVNENEAMLYQVLLGLRDALQIVLKHSVDKRTILENFDLVSLVVDETIDDGIIMETDASVIAARISEMPQNEPSLKNIDLSEKGLKTAFQFARETFSTLKQGL